MSAADRKADDMLNLNLETYAALIGQADAFGGCGPLLLTGVTMAVAENQSREAVLEFIGRMYDAAAVTGRRVGN